jgi:Acyl-CoA dehydrogenase N terminal
MSLILSRRDLHFLLFEWLRIDDLLAAPRYAGHDRETLTAVLDLAEALAEQHFMPANRLADREEPVLGLGGQIILPQDIGKALNAFIESGMLSASQSPDYDGIQLPFAVDRAAFAWL